MKVKINRKELLTQFQIADTIISNDKAQYNETSTLMEAKNNKLEIRINGDGLHLISFLDCEVIEEGRVNLKHDLLEEFVKEIDEEEIEIVTTDRDISVLSKNTIDTKFPILELTEVTIPPVKVEKEYQFDKMDFLKKLERVKFAASIQHEHENLKCIRLEIENQKLKLIATDSFRLAYYEEDYNDDNNSTFLVNIPLRTIDSLMKIIKLTKGENLILKSDGIRIEFNIDDIFIYSKLIELQFPDYTFIFSALNNTNEILIEPNSFNNLLKRLQIFAKKENGSNVIFEIKRNKLKARIENSFAKFKEEIPIVYLGDEEITISLSVRFLLDYLSIMTGNELKIRLDNSYKKPIVILSKTSNIYYYFVMPTRI